MSQIAVIVSVLSGVTNIIAILIQNWWLWGISFVSIMIGMYISSLILESYYQKIEDDEADENVSDKS